MRNWKVLFNILKLYFLTLQQRYVKNELIKKWFCILQIKIGHFCEMSSQNVSYLLLVIFVISPVVISNDISTDDILPKEVSSKSFNEQSSNEVTLSKTVKDEEERHCDSDNSDSDFCRNVGPKPDCLKFDPEKFKTTPSLITYFPFGRLGNTISAYLVS